MDEQDETDQPEKVQAKDIIPKPQVEKPEAKLISSSQTLSSAEYGNQFIIYNPDVSINDVLKEPVEVEVQSIVEVSVLQEKLADQRPPLVDTTVTLIPETTTLSSKQPPKTQLK
ncbi:hypothetical protein Tco_1310723 [Tanacetum coccineum]